MIVEPDEKFNQLITFLKAHWKEKIMLFVSTCAGVDYFSKILPPLLKHSQVFQLMWIDTIHIAIYFSLDTALQFN